jgi:hypothetical protein
MSMPNGSKFKNGYATVDSDSGGLEYRLIAEKMTASGDKISVSTARNLVVRALEKIAREVCISNGVPASRLDEESRRVAFDPRFQESMSSILGDIYSGSR